jgi:hypothetical protein
MIWNNKRIFKYAFGVIASIVLDQSKVRSVNALSEVPPNNYLSTLVVGHKRKWLNIEYIRYL